MKALILGTAGHVDHGKTTLVRCLTGVDTDRWKEEKERGLTIDIGFASLDLGSDLEVGVVDVPGHEDFVKNMLTGSTGVDLLLLVVAADEGPMPQTREHLLIARLLGVSCGVVALTKADRAEPQWRELAKEAVRDELRAWPEAARWPIVEVSAVTGEGLTTLRDALREAADRLPARRAEDWFRMPVDRSFSVHGAGTVVTGTTWSGTLEAGQTVRVLPVGRSARVRSIQVHGRERSLVGPGHRTALALVGLDPPATGRGSCIVREPAWKAVRRLGVRVEVPPGGPYRLESGQRVRVFLGTGEVLARVRLSSPGVLAEPAAWAVLECETPLVPRVRDRFVLRFYSPVRTIGGGMVAELDPPHRWRDRVPLWEGCLADPTRAAIAAVELSGGQGTPADDLPLRTGLAPDLLEALSSPSLRRIGGSWYSTRAFDEACERILTALREAHRSRPRQSAEALESLRAGLVPRSSDQLVAAALAWLTDTGEVVVRGPWVRLPGHEVSLTTGERQARARMIERLREARLEPPEPERLEAELGLDRALRNDLLRLLAEDGLAVAVTPELYLDAAVERELRETAWRIVTEQGTATPAHFKAALGVSRKYLIPILEYLDRVGVTRRTAGGRVAGDRGDASVLADQST